MSYLSWKSEYDRFPETVIKGCENEAVQGYETICATLKAKLGSGKVISVDCYPGVDDSEVLTALKAGLAPDTVFNSEDIFFDGDELTRKMQPFLTDDRVRGVMYYGVMSDFVDATKLAEMQKAVTEANGTVLVYGVGAALVTRGDVFVYADMARWEIQLRYRKGMPNFKQKNFDEDALKKYKRGFFVEWRIADRHKREFYNEIDFYLDTNTQGKPKMVTGKGLREGLKQMTETPFRLVPYFDPGVWGGQWMKEVCGLDAKEKNYAWSFDGVPEENSIYLRFGDVVIESPAMNLTQYQPREFLGQKTFARFGAEFPIRFDFLDTMGGQNLSLQVHPLTEYIKSRFAMPYTQDESYYILDCEEDGGVYLGVKENIDGKAMIADLEEAQKGEVAFDADKYINRFPAKKHDHFLIPAGTIHCSSSNCMVLEISATPYIFTFKLWDWDRLGLDGLPRPIHIEDGKKVIQFDRDTSWVKKHLINNFETIAETPEYSEVKTGLHEYEFIETHVFTSKGVTHHKANGEFAIFNLVDGKGAVIESTNGTFSPYTVHYAETFIVPANAGDYTIRPLYDGDEYKVLRATVRY